MDWIRVAGTIKTDPKTAALAERCDVELSAAIGLVVGVLIELGTHAQDGDISALPDTVIDQWALWRGERGVFAPAFRDLFCNAEGVVAAWDKHNGAAIRRALADAERKRQARAEHRERHTGGRGQVADRRRTSGVTRRDETLRDTTLSTTTTTAVAAVNQRVDSTRPKTKPKTALEQAERPLSLDICIALNRGLAERYGEQPVPIPHSNQGVYQLAEWVAKNDVPREWAITELRRLAASTSAATPPRSGAYWLRPLGEAWAAETTRAAIAATPDLGAATAGPPQFVSGLAVAEAIKYAAAGDAEWQEALREAGVEWQNGDGPSADGPRTGAGRGADAARTVHDKNTDTARTVRDTNAETMRAAAHTPPGRVVRWDAERTLDTITWHVNPTDRVLAEVAL